MKKKLFLGMLAAAGMLLATSCSNDELDVVQSGNEAQVTFSLAAEGGIATRAISDGKSADLLYYAIFDAGGNLITTINGSTAGLLKKDDAFPDGSKKDEVTVTLAKGQEYTAVFWAQDKDCKVYTVTAVNDELKVAVDYEGNNNDETRDAFFKAETFKVTGNAKIDVELKRPFAQINVGVTEADWNAAVASGVKITESKVVIKNAATSINLLTGAVSGNETVVNYISGLIPDETLYVETDATNEGKEAYKWLSMSYILTSADRTTLNSLQYTFEPENGNSIAFAEGLNNVPVQRNWRTNILGKILTGDIQFNITIDPVYDGDIIYPDGSLAQELEFAATFGGTVTLKKDVTLTKPLTVRADMVLNIEEGKSLTGSLNLQHGAHLTVNGGAINNEDESTSGIVSNGNLTLNDVEITSARHALRIESGKVVIYGGTYKVDPKSSKTLYALNVGDAGTAANVIIKGGTFIGPKGTMADSGSAVGVKVGSSVTIEGGNFSGGKNNTLSSNGTLNVVGGTFDQYPAAEYLADGYKAVQNGSNFVVVSNDVNAVVSSTAELSDAIANGNGNANIVLAEDITYGTPGTGIPINNNAVINLNNNTFEATHSFKLGNNADLTMIGGDYVANYSFGHVDVRPTTAEGSVVTFEDVNFSSNYNNSSSTNRLGTVVEVCAERADAHTKILFKNCTFDNAAVLFEGLTDGKTGTIEAVFENCTFNALTSRAPVSVTNFVHGTIKMTGCTFNLECTSSSASAINITFNPTTSVTVTAENNTINAVAATTGVANIKFISYSPNTTVNETGTVKTGIAI